MKKLLAFSSALALFGAGCSAPSVPPPPPSVAPTAPSAVPPSSPQTPPLAPQAPIVPKTTPTAPSAKTEKKVVEHAITSATIQNFAFSPKTIKVKKGDKIVFTNKDGVTHTVTTDLSGSTNAAGFDSGLIQKGQTFTLDTATLPPGLFNYHCTPHPFMTGMIVVE